MGRLIEITDVSLLPAILKLQIDDALLVTATGGRVCGNDHELNQGSATHIELVGIFIQSVIGLKNQIISPMGSSNTVLFIARSPGREIIEVITGDPWSNRQTKRFEIIIEDNFR